MSSLPAAFLRLNLYALLLVACLFGDVARAGMSFQLARAQAPAGAPIELHGVLFNDTGKQLEGAITDEVLGHWTDARGHRTEARFRLSVPPASPDLPARAYATLTWTGRVPTDANGLLTLSLAQAPDSLLALQVTGQAGLPGTIPAHEAVATPSSGPASAQTTAPAPAETGRAAPAPANAALSPFETFRKAISPYDPIYFVAGGRHGATARFQVSFKYRLFGPHGDTPHFMDDWYLGYTQTSLWDLHSDSIPFVDTTYNPSLFWARPALWASPGGRWSLGLNTGLEHKSNGKDGQDSRSLNDFYVQPEFSYRLAGGSTLSLQPRFKYYVATDRDMDYPGALGHVDWKLRWAQDDGLVLSGLYRQGTQGRSATQLEAAWPLKRLMLPMNGHLYVQYFQGYGETLLGYDQKYDPQWRIGIALVP